MGRPLKNTHSSPCRPPIRPRPSHGDGPGCRGQCLQNHPRRERLKILGHARVEDARAHPELAAQLAGPEARTAVERLFIIDVLSFDWNCPKYITPRFTAAEVEEVVAPLKRRIAEDRKSTRLNSSH